jgi:Domain of unknown function (DUF1906)
LSAVLKGIHLGFDGFTPIDADSARAVGAGAVNGYYAPGSKSMTRAWVEAVTAAGLGIWSVWEITANAAENGAPQGRVDAQQAVACAQALGQPKGSAIYITNDSEVSDQQAVIEYFQAAAPIIIAAGYVPGLYGQSVVYSWIEGFGYRYLWHAPDGTPPPYLGAQIVQTGQETLSSGELVDVDEILAADFGGWNANGLFPKAVPVPPKEPELQLPDIVPGQTEQPGKGPGPVRLWIAFLGSAGFIEGNAAHGDPAFSVPLPTEAAIFGPGEQAATGRFRVEQGIDKEPPGIGAVGPECWAAAGGGSVK